MHPREAKRHTLHLRVQQHLAPAQLEVISRSALVALHALGTKVPITRRSQGGALRRGGHILLLVGAQAHLRRLAVVQPRVVHLDERVAVVVLGVHDGRLEAVRQLTVALAVRERRRERVPQGAEAGRGVIHLLLLTGAIGVRLGAHHVVAFSVDVKLAREEDPQLRVELVLEAAEEGVGGVVADLCAAHCRARWVFDAARAIPAVAIGLAAREAGEQLVARLEGRGDLVDELVEAGLRFLARLLLVGVRPQQRKDVLGVRAHLPHRSGVDGDIRHLLGDHHGHAALRCLQRLVAAAVSGV